MSGNKLETVPGNLFAGNIYTTLKVLHLDRNLLTEVPQWLYQSNESRAVFSKLEVLNLCQNNINDLPSKLFSSTSWSSLKTIYLCHNNISSLPLSNLNILKFDYNQITYLPEELFNNQYLQNVIVISFRNNRIKSIPENFFKHLPNLRHIDLQNNNIKHFSQAMLPKRSNNLCSLDLSHNKIISTGHLVKTILRSSQILNFKKCKLDLSYNSLTVQQTNFFPLSIEPKQDRSQIEGELDFSYNRISKFEVATCETVPFFSIKVLRKRDWVRTQGNKALSVVNLVKAALQSDLNHMELGSACLNATKLLTPIKMHRLIIFIRIFMYLI